MRQGYVKVAAVTPKVQVADTEFNGQQIRTLMKETTEQGAKIVVFPELCITGYSCGDLFLQEKLLQEARRELFAIAEESALYDGIFFVGLPFEVQGKLYNMAAAVSGGEILGLIPKCYLPNYNEFYEVRHFTSGLGLCTEEILENGSLVPVCTDLLFYCRNMPRLKIGVEICEDLWAPNPPSVSHALAGASLMVNLSASDEVLACSAVMYMLPQVMENQPRMLCTPVIISFQKMELF